MSNLTTKSGRAKLAPRREPYWLKLATGAYVGFRRGPDTWIARYRDRAGRQHYLALAGAGDYPEAKAAAEKWFAQMQGGARRAPARGTVRAALAAYLLDLRRQGRRATAKEAADRFRLVVDDDLGRLALETVTRDDFEDWRDRLRPGRQPRSINRHVRGVQAALNRATGELGFTGNRSAWKLGSLSDDVDEAGEGAVFLTTEQRELLIAKSGKHLAAFLRGLSHTGARPSELAQATVADFDPRGETLTLRHRKGRPAKLRARATALGAEGAEFFRSQARGKLPAAPLVANASGGHWQRHEWSREIRAVIAVANKVAPSPQRVPAEASAYSFRHARISELLQLYGVDPLTVAQQTGTSVAMMERYYFRFMPSLLRAKLDAARGAR